MKVKLNINGEEVEVTLTPEQLAYIEEQKKPKKFEWKYPRGSTYEISEHRIFEQNNGNDKEYLEHGRYRLTKEVAEQSLARNKRANRLEALAEQIGGLKEFELGVSNYYIYLCDASSKWIFNNTPSSYFPEIVYMTKNCAIEICRMLNAGEFSLDGEL